jgi:hypothetical protein
VTPTVTRIKDAMSPGGGRAELTLLRRFNAD